MEGHFLDMILRLRWYLQYSNIANTKAMKQDGDHRGIVSSSCQAQHGVGAKRSW